MTAPQNIQWFRGYCGRDMLREEGFGLWALFIARRDLMTRREEGYLILAALSIAIRFQSPWGARSGSAWISHGDTRGWRSPIFVSIRSDANEIATRQAQRFSGVRP